MNGLGTIVHAASFEDTDWPVFAHAAAIAHASQRRLVSLHATGAGAIATSSKADHAISQWAVGSELAFETLTHDYSEDEVETLLDGIDQQHPELIVVGTHQKSGLRLLAEGSVSQAVVANCDAPVLIVPLTGRGIVDLDTGVLQVRRILVPVENDAIADRALTHAFEFLDGIGVDDIDVYVVHVGEGDVLETTLFPEREGWRGHRLQREGELNEVISEVCEERGIDLVVMATHGPNSLGDIISGTNTEKTIRSVGCPLLAIPMQA